MPISISLAPFTLAGIAKCSNEDPGAESAEKATDISRTIAISILWFLFSHSNNAASNHDQCKQHSVVDLKSYIWQARKGRK